MKTEDGNSSGISTLHVICKIGDAEYAIPADQVLHMETFEGATPVPGAASYVAGLVQIRQQVVPVLDARARFGLPQAIRSLDTRVIVLQVEARTVGLLVDSAREVQHIPPGRFKPPPEVIAAQSAGFVQSIAQLDQRIVMLLNTPQMIGEETVHAPQ